MRHIKDWFHHDIKRLIQLIFSGWKRNIIERVFGIVCARGECCGGLSFSSLT